MGQVGQERNPVSWQKLRNRGKEEQKNIIRKERCGVCVRSTRVESSQQEHEPQEAVCLVTERKSRGRVYSK